MLLEIVLSCGDDKNRNIDDDNNDNSKTACKKRIDANDFGLFPRITLLYRDDAMHFKLYDFKSHRIVHSQIPNSILRFWPIYFALIQIHTQYFSTISFRKSQFKTFTTGEKKNPHTSEEWLYPFDTCSAVEHTIQ